MKTSLCCVVLAGLIMSALPGCSVHMAATGPREPNLNVVQRGAFRAVVEAEMGPPVSVLKYDMGEACTYQYELGRAPDMGRAMIYLVFDIFTLGLWELIGTPLEKSLGEKHKMVVFYNQDNEVLSVGERPKTPGGPSPAPPVPPSSPAPAPSTAPPAS